MPSTTKSEQLIKQTETFGANTYHPHQLSSQKLILKQNSRHLPAVFEMLRIIKFV
jgi:hypothetical protein